MGWRIALSHHEAHEEGARCVHVPGLPPLCRRCLLLYPLTFAVMILAVVGILPGGRLPGLWLTYVIALAPLPASALFVLEQLGAIPYRPWQIWLGTPLLALGLGLGFARYLRAPGDPLFWGIVLFYGLLCLAALVYRRMGGEVGGSS